MITNHRRHLQSKQEEEPYNADCVEETPPTKTVSAIRFITWFVLLSIAVAVPCAGWYFYHWIGLISGLVIDAIVTIWLLTL